MNQKKSQQLFAKAQNFLPGGVNSPVRAFGAVGGTPPFIESAKGARVFDADNNEFIDFVASWGPMILGHAHPAIISAVQKTAENGMSFGAPTSLEIELASRVVNAVPSIEKVRFVNSGTEATMSAIRLARGFTGRTKILKFAGCYHGHSDLLLAQAGSGIATFGLPDTPGVPAGAVEETLTAPYNDLDAVKEVYEKFPGEIAAIILEPVAANMGVILPKDGFLQGLRRLSTQHGSLLIFDEVITGFRLGLGGAQAHFDVMPDLTCLGKIIGGGMPVGAYGGRAEIMGHIAPEGPVYQAGTLSGNPLAMAAGIAMLDELAKAGVYEQLDFLGEKLATGIGEAAEAAGIPVQQSRVASLLGMFFCESPVNDYAGAKNSNTARFGEFFHAMLENGIYLAPSQFEACFVSLAHTEEDIEAMIAAAKKVMQTL